MDAAAFESIFSDALRFENVSNGLRSVIKPLTDEVTAKLDRQIQRIDNIEITRDEHELKSNIIEQKLDDIEQNQRMNNVRIIGLKQESTDANTPQVCSKILKRSTKHEARLL